MVIVQEPKEYPAWVEKLNYAYEILAQNFIESGKRYVQAFALVNEVGHSVHFDGWPKFENINQNIDHFVDLVAAKFTSDMAEKGIRLNLKIQEVIPRNLVKMLAYDRNTHLYAGDPLAFKPGDIYEFLIEHYAGNNATNEAAKQAAIIIGDSFGSKSWKFYSKENSAWARLPEYHEDGDINKPILPIVKRWAAGTRMNKDKRVFSLRCSEQSVVIDPIKNKVQWSYDTHNEIRGLALALKSFAFLAGEEAAIPKARIETFIACFAATGIVGKYSLSLREHFECGEITFIAFKSKMEIRVSERLFNVLYAFIGDNHPSCKGK